MFLDPHPPMGPLLKPLAVTAFPCYSSCGEVMFSQACVHREEGLLGGSAQGGLPGGGLHPGGGWTDPPPPSTTAYGQHADGMRHTGMHSCFGG